MIAHASFWLPSGTVSYLLVVNPASGAGDDDLPTRATQVLNDVRAIELSREGDLGRDIGCALDEGRIVVACGGDGTVSAVAQHVAGTRGTMAVLPAGTLNHFARDLGVDDPDTALAALEAGHTTAVDVGRAGDRVFVNTVVFGIYPEIVKEREEREQALGKWLALAASVGSVVIGFDPLEGRIAADGRVRRLEATAVFVGNDRFSTRPGSLGRRLRLDEGVLDLRVVRTRTGVAGRASAGWRAAVRRPRRVVGTVARGVRIHLREPRLVAIDGEQHGELRSVRIVSEPGALRVVAPAPEG
jgi:diacylglycerol kinase family enzyme